MHQRGLERQAAVAPHQVGQWKAARERRKQATAESNAAVNRRRNARITSPRKGLEILATDLSLIADFVSPLRQDRNAIGHEVFLNPEYATYLDIPKLNVYLVMTTDYELTPRYSCTFSESGKPTSTPILYVPFRQNQRYEEIQYTFFRGLELMAGNIAPEEELGEREVLRTHVERSFYKQFPQEAGWLMSLPEHLRPGLQSLGLTIPPTWQAVTPDNLSWGIWNKHSNLIEQPFSIDPKPTRKQIRPKFTFSAETDFSVIPAFFALFLFAAAGFETELDQLLYSRSSLQDNYCLRLLREFATENQLDPTLIDCIFQQRNSLATHFAKQLEQQFNLAVR